MTKVLNCSLGVPEFELQSHYYVYFRTDTLEKGMNLFIPLPVVGWMISLLFSYKYVFDIKESKKIDMPLHKGTKLMLWSIWSRFFLWYPILQTYFKIHWGQLMSPSPYFTVLSALWQSCLLTFDKSVKLEIS